MSDETRAKIATEKSGFNQFRNSIYFVERFMKQHNLSTPEIVEHLNRMGTNIGKTIGRELKKTSNNPQDLLTSLYDFILYSKVKVTKSGSIIRVEDRECALCKYKYPDIEVPGCNIATEMMANLLSQNGFRVTKKTVMKSKTWGDDCCVHQYELGEGGK